MTDWFLVLMIWGERYGDGDCNRLITSAFAQSASLQGAVVLTDRTDRKIDARAMQCAIADDFDRPELKRGGFPIKISMFEIDALPEGSVCVYVDLDSAIIGDLGQIAGLANTGPLWTLPTPRARFNAWARFNWRLSKGRRYGAGNSSAFVYRNKFPGNPTRKFRDNTPIFGRQGDKERKNDDRFIGWSCQDIIRPLPSNRAVRFRIEFLELTVWLNRLNALLRKRRRQDLVLVTFDGALTKPQDICRLHDGDQISDHHGRRGLWTDFQMSGLRDRLRAGLQD